MLNFYKAPKALNLIFTVILWYRFVVRSPPPLLGGEPARQKRGDFKGGGGYHAVSGNAKGRPNSPIIHAGCPAGGFSGVATSPVFWLVGFVEWILHLCMCCGPLICSALC